MIRLLTLCRPLRGLKRSKIVRDPRVALADARFTRALLLNAFGVWNTATLRNALGVLTTAA